MSPPTPSQLPRLMVDGHIQLDAQRVVPYLIARGRVDVDRVVREGIQIQDLSRRNLNFRVQYPDGTGLLVKQVGARANPDDFSQLAAEADFLQRLAERSCFDELRPFVPEYVDYDGEAGVVSTNLIHPGTSLTKLHLNGGRVAFVPAAATAMGRLLARYHNAGAIGVPDGQLDDVHPRIPIGLSWALGGGQPDVRKFFDELTVDLETRGCALAAARGWARQAGLIHGDMRLDNILLTSGASPDGDLNLRLIDWELAGRGDSLFDMACLIGDYLRFWVLCAQSFRPKDADDFWDVAPFEIEDMRDHVGLVWSTYVEERGWDDGQEAAERDRLQHLLPAALLGFAWEQMANASKGATLEKAPEVATVLVELARRFEAGPDELFDAWLGIGGEE